MTALLALAATALTGDQLVLIGAVLAIALWFLSFLDDSGEMDDVRHEIDQLPVVRRRDVERIIDARRWR